MESNFIESNRAYYSRPLDLKPDRAVATKSRSHDADFVFRKDFLAQAEFQSSRINVLGAMHCIVVCRLVFADL